MQSTPLFAQLALPRGGGLAVRTPAESPAPGSALLRGASVSGRLPDGPACAPGEPLTCSAVIPFHAVIAVGQRRWASRRGTCENTQKSYPSGRRNERPQGRVTHPDSEQVAGPAASWQTACHSLEHELPEGMNLS